MRARIVAYCGLVCTDCRAFKATVKNDTETLAALALKWYGEENNPSYTICEGCTVDGKKCHWCSECMVHACASERGVDTCAHCEDYGCEKITELFKHIADGKVRLDKIRAGL